MYFPFTQLQIILPLICSEKLTYRNDGMFGNELTVILLNSAVTVASHITTCLSLTKRSKIVQNAPSLIH